VKGLVVDFEIISWCDFVKKESHKKKKAAIIIVRISWLLDLELFEIVQNYVFN